MGQQKESQSPYPELDSFCIRKTKKLFVLGFWACKFCFEGLEKSFLFFDGLSIKQLIIRPKCNGICRSQSRLCS
ncbi:hypothetical protein P8452_06498 [Trifolium repens]|nr:hypothetical protein P8452_06498 [Trifolium repens]